MFKPCAKPYNIRGKNNKINDWIKGIIRSEMVYKKKAIIKIYFGVKNFEMLPSCADEMAVKTEMPAIEHPISKDDSPNTSFR